MDLHERGGHVSLLHANLDSLPHNSSKDTKSILQTSDHSFRVK